LLPLKRKVLTVSETIDGNEFEDLKTVCYDENAIQRFKGMHKASGFQYPHAIQVESGLYIIYSVNKEDIEIKRIERSQVLN